MSGDDITQLEAFWLWVIRKNQAEKKVRVERKVTIGRLTLRYSRRKKTEFWGRFGGGWNWMVGIQVGGTTVIIRLLVASLIFSWKKKERSEDGIHVREHRSDSGGATGAGGPRAGREDPRRGPR